MEGPHVLAEAVACGVRVLDVFGLADDETGRRLAERAGVSYSVVEARTLRGLSGTLHPRGPVAVVEIPTPSPPSRDLIWMAVSDPGNTGTLIRTAAAFGLDVIVDPKAADPWAPKVVRSAAGGHFRTSVTVGPPPAGWGTVALTVRGGIEPDRLPEVLDPRRWWALLVGSEAHGLPRSLVETAPVEVTIPMPGSVESLNAAVAAGIVAHRLSRWRSEAGRPGG